MNIFVLDDDPIRAAIMQCDKHVVKMITESAQMLSTAHRVIDGTLIKTVSKSGKTYVNHWMLKEPYESILMKACHVNHPCNLWLRKNDKNYRWLYLHYQALSEEYSYRYNKKHGGFYNNNIGFYLKNPPKFIPHKQGITDFAIAMKQYPQCIVENDAVSSYRNFYKVAKKSFATWKKRETPNWWREM